MNQKKFKIFDAVSILLLLGIVFIILYPFWSIVVGAFSEPLDYIKNPLSLWPEKWSFYNIKMLLTDKSVWVGYMNTIKYTVVGTVINVCMTYLMAYALTLKELPCKRFISFMITLTLFFGGGMIPTYLTVSAYGLLNTIWAVVLPGAISTYNLMIARTYLKDQIMQSLVEAAEIDGAGPVSVFICVVTPLAKPILAVLSLFYASNHWNAYFDALIYLRDNKKYPLQLYLRELLFLKSETASVTLGEMMPDTFYKLTLDYAVILVSILPLLIIFPFVQRYFVKGVMIGAIKG